MTWIAELAERVPAFLARMRGSRVPGFYRYSLSGDLYGEDARWGLGNSVFAVKILATLGRLDGMDPAERDALAAFIGGFQQPEGWIRDPLVYRRSLARTTLAAVKRLDFNNLGNRQTRTAETRQAFLALSLLGRRPRRDLARLPVTPAEVEGYLRRLDWSRPWGAGSQFSHLVFFLRHHDADAELIEHAVRRVHRLQSPDDGAWYRGRSVSIQQKINGAMKIFTGLRAAGRTKIRHAEPLVDLCLAAESDEQACDHFNVAYALKNGLAQAAPGYRAEEVREFCRRRIEGYRAHYFPEHGAFSFHPGRANDRYYDARITRGLAEPDIHGTMLFLWGLSILTAMTGEDRELGLLEIPA